MLRWFKRKSDATVRLPANGEGNPGIGPRVAMSLDGGRTLEIDTVQLLGEALLAGGYAFSGDGSRIDVDGSGLSIRPQIVQIAPASGGFRTVTTVEIQHEGLGAHGPFEYQHAANQDPVAAVRWGLEQWVSLDLVVILDALRELPTECMMMEMVLPADAAGPERARRAVLGPVGHMMAKPQPDLAAAEEHPFCACCMLTRSFEAFKPVFESRGFFGIRLFASRDDAGRPQADCRINGEDWEPGARALREYVKTWPQAGVEFRKQYVVLHDRPASAAAATSPSR